MSTSPQPPLQGSRVLSIQSHVVHGYVGNKCAVLPLNRFGFDVDAINSVQFSNHTGYPSFEGSVVTGEDLKALLHGLEINGLHSYSYLLTGYIGSLSLLEAIVDVVKTLRRVNPNLIYVCDPVQGDDGRIYCKEGLPEAFRERILPLASIITPNQFEAELLSGMSITNEADALEVCRALQARGPHTVIITSMKLQGSEDMITVIASTTIEQEGAGCRAFKLQVSRINAYFTGTGDLFTALILAQLHSHPQKLCLALELAVAGLQAVLLDTAAAAEGSGSGHDRSALICAKRELRLIQNQDKILSPEVSVKAQALAEFLRGPIDDSAKRSTWCMCMEGKESLES